MKVTANKWFLPLVWASKILTQGLEEGRVRPQTVSVMMKVSVMIKVSVMMIVSVLMKVGVMMKVSVLMKVSVMMKVSVVMKGSVMMKVSVHNCFKALNLLWTLRLID